MRLRHSQTLERYGEKSVAARVTDQSDRTDAVDRSAGTAYALGITGRWNNVTVSAP